MGRVDSEGEFSGPSIAFIYPDLSTALLGTFSREQMVAGQAVTVTGTGRVVQSQDSGPRQRHVASALSVVPLLTCDTIRVRVMSAVMYA